MAGLGRRTHYRKHLTDAVLFDLPEPASNERIGKVVATRGSNQFDVHIATAAAASKQQQQRQQDSNNSTVLAILPTKFRKLVWLKRNDYVICQTVVDDKDEVDDNKGEQEHVHDDKDANINNKNANNNNSNEGIRYMITHILYKDQIQHLLSQGLWPDHDPNFVSSDARAGPAAAVADNDAAAVVQDDGIVYAQDYHDDDDDYEGGDGSGVEDGSDYEFEGETPSSSSLFVNTNRIATLALEDSSSSDD